VTLSKREQTDRAIRRESARIARVCRDSESARIFVADPKDWSDDQIIEQIEDGFWSLDDSHERSVALAAWHEALA
jgi:hypothetical protein